MIKKKVFYLILTLLFLTSCGDEENEPEEYDLNENQSSALQEAVDYAVIPAVDTFVVRANAYSASADAFCETPDQDKLSALRQAWKNLFAQWFRLANYNFGPLNDDLVFPKYIFIDSLRLRGTDYLVSVRDAITDSNSNGKTLDSAYFASQAFTDVGLLALESITFETATSDHSQNAVDILAEYEREPRKCEILKGLAQQIVNHGLYVQSGWKDNFKLSGDAYRSLFLDGQLEDGLAPLTKLVVSVQEYLDYLQKRNVVTTAARISGYAWDGLSASVDEIEVLLEGTEETTISFFSLMEAAGFQLAVASVRASIEEVRKSITARDVAMLDIALGKLDGNFKREIPGALEVDLDINFSDGD